MYPVELAPSLHYSITIPEISSLLKRQDLFDRPIALRTPAHLHACKLRGPPPRGASGKVPLQLRTLKNTTSLRRRYHYACLLCDCGTGWPRCQQQVVCVYTHLVCMTQPHRESRY